MVFNAFPINPMKDRWNLEFRDKNQLIQFLRIDGIRINN